MSETAFDLRGQVPEYDPELDERGPGECCSDRVWTMCFGAPIFICPRCFEAILGAPPEPDAILSGGNTVQAGTDQAAVGVTPVAVQVVQCPAGVSPDASATVNVSYQFSFITPLSMFGIARR